MEAKKEAEAREGNRFFSEEKKTYAWQFLQLFPLKKVESQRIVNAHFLSLVAATTRLSSVNHEL